MKAKNFQHIFEQSFDDPAAWRRWFFDNVVADDDIYIAADSRNKPAAALLMQRYDMQYCGRRIPTGYISCVGTLPQARGKGLASTLLRSAICDAHARGMALCELIPAQNHLFYFYRHAGFSTAFYADRERYTSLHNFSGGRGHVVQPTYSLMNNLEKKHGGMILHSEQDYANILTDLALDGEHYAIGATDDAGNAAVLFATADAYDGIKVKSLLADSRELALTALAELRQRAGNKPITVYLPPVSHEPQFITARGMVRITDAVVILGVLAADHPHLHIAIRLHDSIVEANTGIYIIKDGGVTRTDATDTAIDLDIDIAVLASILFSSHDVGRIFGLPTQRPYMALMLD